MRSARTLLALLAFFLGVGVIPHRLCGREAPAWFEGDPPLRDGLGARVARWTRSELTPASFATGAPRFDEEWVFGTYAMAALGFAQVAAESDGERRSEAILRLEHCLDALLSPQVRAFDVHAWGQDVFSDGGARGHVAYLGYAGLPLALHGELVGTSRFESAQRAFDAAISSRFEAAADGLVETYPREIYPVDNASALAAMAVSARARGTPPRPSFGRGLDALRRAIDPSTGLLAQSIGGPARGSGSALAAFFLSHADPPTSASLYRAVRATLYRTVLGFGAVLEHPRGRGAGDIDSGPMLFGYGVSATGFALGASRVHGDREAFAALYATVDLFGAPENEGGERTFATGGPLGDAILFAMLTAPRSTS
jgi:hypothetical protein